MQTERGSVRKAAGLISRLCVAEVLTMLGTFAFAALLPTFVQEWGLSNTEAGWINGVYFAGYTVMVPVLAALTDRIDSRRIYLLFAGVGAVATLGFALLADGFWSALVLRAAGGVGLAGTFIPGLKALVDRLEGTAQARAVSFYTATFSLGTACSVFVAGELSEVAGWRSAFAVAAGGCVVALILVALTLQPQRAVAKTARDGHLLDFRPVLGNRTAMAYVLAYATHTWELFAARSWMVAFLAFSLSLDPGTGGYWSPTTVTAVAGVIAMWSSIAGGELALRFGRNRTLTVIMCSSAVFGCSIGFGAALPYPMVAALCVIYMLFVQGDSAALHTGAVQSADPERRGATMAVQSVVGFASAAAGPVAVGMVLDLTGGGSSPASWGFAFAAMGAVVALGPLVLARMSVERRT